jgi:hypothetical protein
MRKNHQRQISELLKTLGEAHAEIKRRLLSGDIPSVMRLLSDCQDGAVQVGNFIEKLEGEGTKPVTLLEEYCESLYRTGLEAEYSDMNGESAAKRVKRLQAQLVAIDNSVKTELAPDRIEIAFIPYKASMWDALESVWLSAEDDPSCDAYVIPAPYCDRLPDGSFGRMHYEGGEYPDYVPVTDWRDYDFEERRPDMIFTHNPYDGGNLVTSIHPDFYCERLKPFTDLLVYIPYFVTVDDVPEHFCVCAGTLHADRVIVQSEKVRETYIRVFKEFEKKNNCRGRFGRAEDKFLALGSPKFDKVLNTKKEDCDISAGWRRLVEKPDGTRKHIILYNTSIAAILEGNERYLKKLRSVLDTFRGYDDVVLWWRPHPLNAATYESMRPQLLAEYESLIASYRRAGFGIYDDTPDLHRAIAYSDAYYGDWSSLVAMYGLTGKPVMLSNTSPTDDGNHWNNLLFGNLCEDGEYFWFTAVNFNALFRMDRRTWQAEYMGSFPIESNRCFFPYGDIVKLNGILYFTPYSANEVAFYDIGAKLFGNIPLKLPQTQTKLKYLSAQKFCFAHSYNDWIYFLPCTFPAIVRYDTVSGVTEYFSGWVAPLEKRMTDPDDVYFFNSATIDGRFIVAAACCANAVVMFDMEAGTSVVHEVGSSGCGYSGVCFDGENIWLSPRHNSPVVRWNPKTYECKEYADFPESFTGAKYGFWNILYADGCVWLFPFAANMVLKVNIRNGSIAAADMRQIEPGSEGGLLLDDGFILSRKFGHIVYAHTYTSNRFISYDSESGCYREETVPIPVEAIHATLESRIFAFNKDVSAFENIYDCYYYESPSVPLRDYIDRIAGFGDSESRAVLCDMTKKMFKEVTSCPNGDSGASVYAHCRKSALG